MNDRPAGRDLTIRLTRLLDFLRRCVPAVIWPDHCLVCGAFLEHPAERGACLTCLEQIDYLPSHSICTRCGIPLLPAGESAPVCPTCRKTARLYDLARSCGPYSGRLRELIVRLKFHHQPRLHVPLGTLLTSTLDLHLAGCTIDRITHVPLHADRRRQRGYDQARLLAEYVARQRGLRHQTLLCKTRPTVPQSSLPLEKRAANVRGSYRVTSPKKCRDRNILLVDDVITTGCTVDACCRELVRAGAARVYVLSLARAILEHPAGHFPPPSGATRPSPSEGA